MDADARGNGAGSPAAQARLAALPGVGNHGVRVIADAHIAVVGAGGLGCPVLLGLAAAGVGHLTVIDDDRVAATNLGRQTLFRASDIGRFKVEAAAHALDGFETSVLPQPLRLDDANATVLLRGVDLVIDGTDDAATRFAVADACATLDVPLVWGSVLGFDGLATVFTPGGPGIDDLLDRARMLEAPAVDCGVTGVWSPLCAQLGAVLVSNALQLLTGVGTPLVGRVLTMDARTNRTREIALAPRANRETASRRAVEPTNRAHEITDDSRAASTDAADTIRCEAFAPGIRAREIADDPSADTARSAQPTPSTPALPPLVIDVHPGHASPAEPHTLHIPLEELADRLDEVEVALGGPSRPLHTRCTNGPRARAAATLLREAGWPQARVMPDPREGA